MANTEMADKYASTIGNFSKYIGSDGTECDILDTSNNSLQVTVVSGSTAGTEYTEGDADASLTGPVIMWEDAADAVVATSAAKPLPVEVISGSAAGTEYTEDAASAGGESGPLIMVVRQDTAASPSDTDGDYQNLIAGALGHLWTEEKNSAAMLTSLQIIDNWDSGVACKVVGAIAHDAVDSGDPIKVGFKAKAFDGTAAGTDVAEDDRVNAIATVEGRQYVETSHPNYWSASVDYASAQTNATVKAAAGADLKLYITDIFVSNGAVAGNITLLDGSGGAVLFESYPAINGGSVLNLKTPIALTANTLLAITSTTVTTHSVTVSGFIAA